jgi:hypothetical protein
MENEKQRYLENLTLYQSLKSLVEDYYIETTLDSNHTNLQSEHKVTHSQRSFLYIPGLPAVQPLLNRRRILTKADSRTKY